MSLKSERHYYAVIFTSKLKSNAEGYEEMAKKMLELASDQIGYLGVESARGTDGIGITVSYWSSLEAIKKWKENLDHQEAQRLGKTIWYQNYTIRIAKIENEYQFGEW